MARPGETEVFRMSPRDDKVGKCYEMIIPTRYIITGGKYRFFSTNEPRYLGEFVSNHRYSRENRHIRPLGYVVGYYIFNDGGKENKIEYYFGVLSPCFYEVPCKLQLNSKAKNQAVRNVYESKTGQSAAPGTGPANLIRGFAGITVPKGAEGGKRKTRKMRKSRSKKTRSRK